MWIFAPFGLIMPSIRPPATVPEGDLRTIQIRTRREVDLTRFRDEFMAPGTVGEIIATPTFDYNFRAYCTPEDLAAGVAKLMLTVDYEKFKPTAERYSDNSTYHSVLNSIWGSVCRLNQPWQGLPSWTNYRSTPATGKGYAWARPSTGTFEPRRSLDSALAEELPESHLESTDWSSSDEFLGIVEDKAFEADLVSSLPDIDNPDTVIGFMAMQLSDGLTVPQGLLDKLSNAEYFALWQEFPELPSRTSKAWRKLEEGWDRELDVKYADTLKAESA
jgi:hypothetical protein